MKSEMKSRGRQDNRRALLQYILTCEYVSILRDTVQICERILSQSMVFAHRCSMLSEKKRERER